MCSEGCGYSFRTACVPRYIDVGEQDKRYCVVYLSHKLS